MTDDYTPSLAEMREYVEEGGEPRPWVALDVAEKAREKFRGEAFDRMIAQVKAEALREAREALIGDQINDYGIVLPDVDGAVDLLEERAHQIEKEAGL